MNSEMPSNASQLDKMMCFPYNRRGLLCGECKDGYGPAVYSFDQIPYKKYIVRRIKLCGLCAFRLTA